MSDYTKGEWSQLWDGEKTHIVTDHKTIATMWPHPNKNTEGEANAHLIASAPKQNQALIWVAEWLGIRPADGEKPNRADVVRVVKEALASTKDS